MTANGDTVTVLGPPGTDGKAWYFRQLALGRMWFNNIPNYLAGSPNPLLLPRKVVANDGLQKRE